MPIATLRLFALASLALAAGGTLAACGDDGPYYGGVGAPCRGDRDCPIDATCEHKGQGGECTFDCRFHDECPPGWACVNSHGGSCHSLCDSDRDCPVGFECKKKDNEDGRGDSLVCEP